MNENVHIAVIGMGCRFPAGASDPDKLWRLLQDRVDAIRPIPKNRWDLRQFYSADPGAPGMAHVACGGFLADQDQTIEQFDPLFFGITPREAAAMDPMQRLLLEVSWEAFEDAGLQADRLAGSQTGVFVGGFCVDNLLQNFHPSQRDLADTHTAANSTLTMLANRLSYVFDLRGPSMSLDTACSSSLVATHYACQALLNDEADVCLAGGANMMFRPEYFIAMSKGRFLSEAGRCFAWDERAAGYARGEGAGIVVLKRLDRALADGDRIRAVIEATGVNHDGRTVGISLPSSAAQQDLLEQIYARAGVDPQTVDYVEAHGTGTQAGDPAELAALDAVIGRGRRDDARCHVGTIKTNIGHLEAAAGVAGLIKAVLVLEHRQLVPNLHFDRPNPAIPFAEMGLQVVTEPVSLPAAPETLRAAVNSFGYGGSNAHVLLRNAPEPQITDQAGDQPAPALRLLPISAQHPDALADLAGKWAFRLTARPSPLADICQTAACHRAHLRERAVILAEDAGAALSGLHLVAKGKIGEQGVRETSLADPGPLTFIYTGMGPQWAGMGQQLLVEEPVFAKALEEFDTAFQAQADWSILAALRCPAEASRMAETRVAQPANFAIQYGLTQLWRHWGLQPAAIVGHSVGEVAAAWAAGALDLTQAIRVSIVRSELQQELAGSGSMLAVGLDEAACTELIAPHPEVSIAAINSAQAITLAGPVASLQSIEAELQERQVFARQLEVEVPYHSPAMDAIKTALHERLDGLSPRRTTCLLYSSVNGGPAVETDWDAAYWWRNVREPVRFADAMQGLLASDHSNYLEIGPHPVLRQAVREAAGTRKILQFASLHRREAENLHLRKQCARLWALGYEIDWQAVNGRGQRIALPSYPWRRQPCWREPASMQAERCGSPGHPFLQRRLAGPVPAWQCEITQQQFPWLTDHRVGANTVFPGAGYIEAFLAARLQSQQTSTRLEQISFHAPLIITGDATRLRLDNDTADGAGTARLSVHAQERGADGDWRLHASAQAGAERPAPGSWPAVAESSSHEQVVEAFYAELRERGLHYGPWFRPVQTVQRWCRDDDTGIAVQIDVPSSTAYFLHPVVLDAVFQAILTLMPGELAFLPVGLDSLNFHARPKGQVTGLARITWHDARGFTADFQIQDDHGAPLVIGTGLRCVAVQLQTRQAPQRYLRNWIPVEEPAEPTNDANGLPLAVLASEVPADLAETLALTAQAADAEAFLHLQQDGQARHWILDRRQGQTADWEQLLDDACLISALARSPAADVPQGLTLLTSDDDPWAQSLGQLLPLLAAESGSWQVRHVRVAPDCRAADLGAAIRQPIVEQDLRVGPDGSDRLRLILDPQTPSTDEEAILLPEHRCRLQADGQFAWQATDSSGSKRCRIDEVLLETVDAALSSGQVAVEGRIDRYRANGLGLIARVTPLRVDDEATSPQSGIALLPGALAIETDYDPRLFASGNETIDLALLPVALAIEWTLERFAGCRSLQLLGAPAGQDEALGQLLTAAGVTRVSSEGEVVIRYATAADQADDAIGDACRVLVDADDPALYTQTNHHGQKATRNRIQCQFDLDRLCHEDPALAGRLLARALEHLPPSAPAAPDWQLADWQEALKAAAERPVTIGLAASGGQDDRVIPGLITTTDTGPALRADGQYLVVGGTRGFGLAIVQYLLAHGAGQVIAVSRRGSDTPDLLERPDLLADPRLRVHACDVGSASAVQDLVERQLPAPDLQLRGVIHAATVLDDALLADCTREHFATLLAAKAQGAWHLHTATSTAELDHFLLCSSIACMIGNPGQAPYVLANAFLEGLTDLRRRQGRPACTIALGALADSGLVARDAALASSLHKHGLELTPTRDALAAIGHELRQNQDGQVGLFTVRWQEWARRNPILAAHSRMHELVDQQTGDEQGGDSLAAIPEAERHTYVTGRIGGILADILGMDAEDITEERSIVDLGIDSLMSVEFSVSLRSEFGVQLSAMDLLQGPSVNHLADRVLQGSTGN